MVWQAMTNFYTKDKKQKLYKRKPANGRGL